MLNVVIRQYQLKMANEEVDPMGNCNTQLGAER